jgi:hypothetical protein
VGTDFIVSRAKQFKRSWDRGLAELSTPNLFSAKSLEHQQAFSGIPRSEHVFRSGEECLLRASKDHKDILIFRETSEVGRITSPPASLIGEIEQSGFGVAMGIVHQVHPISGVAEISIR